MVLTEREAYKLFSYLFNSVQVNEQIVGKGKIAGYHPKIMVNNQ